MNILLFRCSPRNYSNTNLFVGAFSDLVVERGHSITIIDGNKVSPCKGCYECLDNRCVQNDIFPAKMDFYDVIIFASPIYFFYTTSQAKACIDRMFGINTKNRVLSLMLFSGSPFKESGSKIIIKSFKMICKYCGFEYGGCFHKQTNDLIFEPDEDDKKLLLKYLKQQEKRVKSIVTKFSRKR